MKKYVLLVFGLLLVLCLVLAGCNSQITAEEIVSRMQETVESTEDAHAVVNVSVNAQGIEMSASAEVWEKSPSMVRAQVLESSETKLVGSTMVSDGEQTWLYDPTLNRVIVGPAGDMETPLPQEMVSSLQETIQKILDDIRCHREEIPVETSIFIIEGDREWIYMCFHQILKEMRA